MSIVAQTLTRAARVATLPRWQRTAVADLSATRSLPRTLTHGKLKGVGSQVAARLPGAVAFGVGALALRLASRFRRDIDGAYRRLEALESTVTITAAGPTEYTTFGAGPPVLVIHGNGGGFDQGVESAQPTLGETFRAIVPSRFGYLRTPLPTDASPAQQADAYASLLDHLGIARAAVIAYSAGSTSAIQFALRHPARTAALVLCSPNAPGDVPPLPPQAIMSHVFGSDFLFWTAITFFRPYLQRMAMGVPEGFELNAEDEITVRRMLTQVLPVKPRAAGMIFDSYVSNPDINTGYPFARIEVPTLVVSAQDDPMALYTHARTLAQLIPDATLLTLTCGGHLMLGQAEHTGPAIRKFLRQHMAL